MALGRKVVSEDEAQRCLKAVAAARVELGEWARAHGIDGRSLNAWKVNLLKRGVPQRRPARAAARLVELVPAGAPKSSSRYVVRVGALALELGDEFDHDSVRRLVGLLRSC